MRKLIPPIILLLSFSSVFSLMQLGGQKKPGIGLLTFSVNAFDEESKKINAGLKALKGVLYKELKKRFEIVGETSDEITYSDIEFPEVTIDPVFKSESNKKLEKLCEKGWDGLVFGHFHQEDKLVVVTRFYLSKNKYPNQKKDERIISSPEIEIPTTNLGQKSLETHTAQSIQELIKAIETERPEFFEPIKKKTSGTPDTKKPQIPEEPPPKKALQTPQDKKKPQTQKQTTVEEDYRVEPLTAHDVYKMIIDNGFYCEIVKGRVFHGEGLRGINIPKNGIFKEKRVVTAVKKNGLIKTESQSINQLGNKILLWWSSGKTNKCSYKGAVNIIEKLNDKNRDKTKKWRIPTLMEMFSIVKEKTANHFPNIFKFPAKTDLIFWTSTPVKKEGTVLDYDKEEKAYFVIESYYSGRTGNYSLRFSFQNIEEKLRNNTYLLPVYSDKVYSYKPQSGFDTNSKKSTSASGGKEKIPGFDDPPSKIIHKKAPPRTIEIALFPYINKGMTDNLKEKFSDTINNELEETLELLSLELSRKTGRNLEIDKKTISDNSQISAINTLYLILSDPKISDTMTLNRIIREIMLPLDIDILVTVKHSLENISGVENFDIFIIDGLYNEIYKRIIIQNVKDNRFKRLRKVVAFIIRKIVFK